MRHLLSRLTLAVCLGAVVLPALPGQVFGPAATRVNVPPPESQQQPPVQPPAPQPQPAAPAPTTQAAVEPAKFSDTGGLMLGNASLTDMISMLAKRLKINYLLDPTVNGSVTIYTYGEIKPVELRPLLETILRVNGATMVQVGDLYRIVPIQSVSRLPLAPQINADGKTLPDDERMILNLVFLKYATAAEMVKLITPFLGEGATLSTYEPANLLLMEDNSRSMKRTMELLAMFDSDTFAGQRVRLFDVTNSRPSQLVKELDSVFKAYALSEKSSVVKFVPVDRINTLIAVAPNPGVFTEVKKWIDKLDVAVKIPAGDVTNYIYRLKYGRAETVAMAIMALYTGNTMMLVNLSMMVNNAAMAGQNGGSYGTSMYGNMQYGNTGYGSSGYGNQGYSSGSGYSYGGMGYGNQSYGGTYQSNASGTGGAAATVTGGAMTGAADQTGGYLNAGAGTGGRSNERMPHVIPNPFDNTILIQGTPQEYEQILNLLRQLDVAPRQVLIEAKIYEVTLGGSLSAGVSTTLQKNGTTGTYGLLGSVASSTYAGLSLSQAFLVRQSRELLATVSALETSTKARVISAPSIICTDSVAATMTVGDDIQMQSSTVTTGTLSTTGYTTRSTGVTLSITPRVNSSGIVTMVINQQVSKPDTAGSSTTSVSNQSFSTQLTVRDGDTVALAGFISETVSDTSSGVPVLHRIPFLGAAFGSKTTNKSRTELILFLTPRVIYDATQVIDASDEIKSGLKRIQKMVRDDQ